MTTEEIENIIYAAAGMVLREEFPKTETKWTIYEAINTGWMLYDTLVELGAHTEVPVAIVSLFVRSKKITPAQAKIIIQYYWSKSHSMNLVDCLKSFTSVEVIIGLL